jgi:hypothetical protein
MVYNITGQEMTDMEQPSQNPQDPHVEAIQAALKVRGLGLLNRLDEFTASLFPESDQPATSYLQQRLQKHQQDWEKAPQTDGERPAEAPVPVSTIADALSEVLKPDTFDLSERQKKRAIGLLGSTSFRGLVKAHHKRTRQAADIARKELIKNGTEIHVQQLFTLHGEDEDSALTVFELLNKGALEEESARLEHCVGTDDHYINEITKRRSRIFSVRARDGSNSRCTIEYNVKNHSIVQIRGESDAEVLEPDMLEAVFALRQELGIKNGRLAAMEGLALRKGQGLSGNKIFDLEALPQGAKVELAKIGENNLDFIAKHPEIFDNNCTLQISLKEPSSLKPLNALLEGIKRLNPTVGHLWINGGGRIAGDPEESLVVPEGINVHGMVYLQEIGDVSIADELQPTSITIETHNARGSARLPRLDIHCSGQINSRVEDDYDSCSISGYEVNWRGDEMHLTGLMSFSFKKCDIKRLPDILTTERFDDALEIIFADCNISPDAWKSLSTPTVQLDNIRPVLEKLPPINADQLYYVVTPVPPRHPLSSALVNLAYGYGTVSTRHPDSLSSEALHAKPFEYIIDDLPPHIEIGQEATCTVVLNSTSKAFELDIMKHAEKNVQREAEQLENVREAEALEAYLAQNPGDASDNLADELDEIFENPELFD